MRWLVLLMLVGCRVTDPSDADQRDSITRNWYHINSPKGYEGWDCYEGAGNSPFCFPPGTKTQRVEYE